MKKIDTWLSIQRYVVEMSQATATLQLGDVEMWGKTESSETSPKQLSRTARKNRRFLLTNKTFV